MNVLKVLFDGSPPQLKTLTMCFVRKKKKKKKVEKDVICVDLFHFRLFQTISVLIIILNLYDENVNG